MYSCLEWGKHNSWEQVCCLDFVDSCQSCHGLLEICENVPGYQKIFFFFWVRQHLVQEFSHETMATEVMGQRRINHRAFNVLVVMSLFFFWKLWAVDSCAPQSPELTGSTKNFNSNCQSVQLEKNSFLQGSNHVHGLRAGFKIISASQKMSSQCIGVEQNDIGKCFKLITQKHFFFC